MFKCFFNIPTKYLSEYLSNNKKTNIYTNCNISQQMNDMNTSCIFLQILILYLAVY